MSFFDGQADDGEASSAVAEWVATTDGNGRHTPPVMRRLWAGYTRTRAADIREAELVKTNIYGDIIEREANVITVTTASGPTGSTRQVISFESHHPSYS